MGGREQQGVQVRWLRHVQQVHSQLATIHCCVQMQQLQLIMFMGNLRAVHNARSSMPLASSPALLFIRVMRPNN